MIPADHDRAIPAWLCPRDGGVLRMDYSRGLGPLGNNRLACEYCGALYDLYGYRLPEEA